MLPFTYNKLGRGGLQFWSENVWFLLLGGKTTWPSVKTELIRLLSMPKPCALSNYHPNSRYVRELDKHLSIIPGLGFLVVALGISELMAYTNSIRYLKMWIVYDLQFIGMWLTPNGLICSIMQNQGRFVLYRPWCQILQSDIICIVKLYKTVFWFGLGDHSWFLLYLVVGSCITVLKCITVYHNRGWQYIFTS